MTGLFVAMWLFLGGVLGGVGGQEQETLVSMELRDVPALSVLTEIAAQAGRELAISPKVDTESTMSMVLREVPWSKALEIFASSQELSVHVCDGVVLVLPLPASATRVVDEP